MRKGFAVAAAAAALVAGGCGGDDALTKAEFVEQGNKICADASAELERQAEETFGGGETPDEAAQLAFVEDVVLPSVQQQIDDLAALEPPEEDVETVDDIIATAQEAIDAGEEDIEALAAAQEDPFAEANQKAEDYGLTECA